MNIVYVKNPPEYEARWFTGGRENATEITGWLADHEIHSAWYDRYENEDQVRPEYILIELDNEEDTAILPQIWLAIDENNQLTAYSDETFRKTFHIKHAPAVV